jgi:16S rRNA (adenine1518-N6/adenine1519-N6)-dimethyltransferase
MFMPRPKVDASVLAFERQTDPALAVSETVWSGLSEFIDAAFAQRRKMLSNSLAARWRFFPSKAALAAALEAMEISQQARAENLTPVQFLDLYRRLLNAAPDGSSKP